MAVLESILAGVAVNLLKAVSNKTVKALKQLFSGDELKSVLEKAYLDFKKSIPKENKEKEEEKLLQVFEKFFADDRIKYEFRLVFEGRGDEVDLDILAEIFVPIYQNNGIELRDYDFFYQAMSDVIKKIEELAHSNKKFKDTFQLAHLERIYERLEKPGMEHNHTLVRRKYLRQLRTHNERLQFIEIRAPKEKKDIQLQKVFVMQRVMESFPNRDYERLKLDKTMASDEDFTGDKIQPRKMMTAQKEKGEKKESMKFDKLFKGTDKYRFVVLGKPGSGKSTLLKYLMLEAVEKILENPREIPSLSLPILLEIRKFENALSKTNRTDYSILDYLYASMRQSYNLTLPKKFFEKYLDNGRVLLLFDGLDEVVDESRRVDILQMISTFVTRYNRGNRVIITSRIAGYSRVQLSTTDYRHFTLGDFNEEEVEEFIHKWYQSRLINPAEAGEKAGDLKVAIEKKPAIKELAKIPLLLTIIGIIHRYESQLPEDRLELYHKATEALLYTWDIGKGIIDEKFKLSHRRRFLEKVAFHLQSIEKGNESETVMERSELYNILLSDFCQVFDCKNWEAREMVDEFLEVIRTRAGLLMEQVSNQYGFVHKTFQEYFAAMWIANETIYNFNLQVMINYVDQFIDNAFWHETLLLSLRALPNRQTLIVLEHILNRDPRGIESYFYYNHFFIMRFIAEKGQWLANRNFVEKQINDFFDFSWDEGKDRSFYSYKTRDRFKIWVSYITDSLTSSILSEKLLTLTEDENQLVELRQYCAQAMGNQGFKDEAMVERLFKIAEDGNQDGGLRRYCAEAVGNLGFKEKAVDILAKMAENENLSEWLRRYCAQALSNLGLKDKAVNILMKMAKDKKMPGGLRVYCAQAVGNLGFKKKAVDILMKMAENENLSGWMRGYCAQAVSNLESQKKSVVERLLRMIEEKNSPPWLQQSCAYAVGKLGDKDKAVVERLLKMAEDKNQDSVLRRYCAQAVGNLGFRKKVMVDRLLKIAEDESQDGGLRRYCAEAVGKLGFKEKAEGECLLVLAEDKTQDSALRRACAESVGNLGFKEKAVEILIKMAEDENQKEGHRRDCAEAMAHLGYKDKAVDILIKLYLAQPDKYRRDVRQIYNLLWEMTEV